MQSKKYVSAVVLCRFDTDRHKYNSPIIRTHTVTVTFNSISRHNAPLVLNRQHPRYTHAKSDISALFLCDCFSDFLSPLPFAFSHQVEADAARIPRPAVGS